MLVCCLQLLGIQPWEDKYREMATAMGIDPSVSSNDHICTYMYTLYINYILVSFFLQTNNYVPFNPIDIKVSNMIAYVYSIL